MSKKSSKETLNKEFDLHSIKKLADAISIAKKTSNVKFTASIDIDIVLHTTEKQKKESIRGSVDLPNTFGEDKKVVVLTSGENIDIAKKAGAVAAGLDDVKQDLLDGKIEFDIVVATPDVMPKIVELGKVLGPKGLMPNPKNGTITTDIAKAVESFKGGKVNFKMEQGQSTVRGKVADVSMTEEQIEENVREFIKAVQGEARKLAPQPFKKITISTTMGPGIKVDINDII